jgi:tetratricopeptide (TPR) repeat protein
VIGTFRESDVGTDHPLVDALALLHRESGVERVALRGLGDDELLTLLETTAGHAMAEEGVALRDALLAETDGNPFFVGEMLRHLAETGTIYLDDQGRWVASPDVRISGLPVSIREVIGRRVARLGTQTRGTLSLAAVIGRDFDVDVLARVTKLDEDTVVDLCDQAVTAAVLTEADVAGRYTFAHALIEHALYDDLSAGRRARAHRMVGEALEELWGDDPAERIGELAYHWAHATQPPGAGKAITYAQRAGDRALAQLAPEEARRWYMDALDLMDRTPTDDPRRRATLLLGLGDAQRQTGDPGHRETLLAAGRLADEVDATDILVRAVLRNNRGWASIIGGVDHERIDMLERALSRLGDTDSPDRARLLALLCAERTWGGDFDERLAIATQAVDMARRTGDNAAFVDAVRLWSNSITMPGTLELRRVWTAEACALADDLGDPTARLFAYLYRSLGALEAGDITTMRRAFSIFHSESERIGQPFDRWQIVHTSAWRQMLEGDVDAAEQFATQALPLGTAAGITEDAAFIFGGQLLSLRWMQGRGHEIIPLIEEIAHDNPGRQIFRALLAYAKSLDNADHEVRQLLDTELTNDFFVSSDGTWLVAQVLWSSAAVHSRHRPAATALYERLLPWHKQFATTHITVNGAVAHYLGLLAHTLDRDDEAERWFSQALAMHETMKAPFFVALTQAAWADLLTDRNQPGDAQRAQALVDAALPVASERGYGHVERDARSVLERIE